MKPTKDQPFKVATHPCREENESRVSTKFVQLNRNETTSGEAFVSLPDCQEPLNLAKKRKFEANEQSDNCEPLTQNNIANSVAQFNTDKSLHQLNDLSSNNEHFKKPETEILRENLNQTKQDWWEMSC